MSVFTYLLVLKVLQKISQWRNEAAVHTFIYFRSV